MRVILSAAVTADGYLDDNGPGRLVISTPGDWAAVARLRAGCDAILVGAETVRRDNPSLSLRATTPNAPRRAARGLRPDLSKAVVTRSGRLDPSLIFSPRAMRTGMYSRRTTFLNWKRLQRSFRAKEHP